MARDRDENQWDGGRHMKNPSTRRQFLHGAIRLGIGAAALTALGPPTTQPVIAGAKLDGRPQVLIDDLVESSAADFGRGVANGVRIVPDAAGAALRGARGGTFMSGPLRLPFASTHLGLHWVLRGGSPETVVIEVRTSDDGQNWSVWQPVSVEAVADVPDGTEVFAALISGERRSVAQYRVMFASDDAAIIRMTVTTINVVDGPQVSAATSASEASSVSLPVVNGTSISIVTRAGWSCDETFRFQNGTEIWPEMYVPAKKIVLHHTATSNTYVDGAAEVRAIYTYHARTLGWGDIGYNLLIDKFGTIYEGRHGRGEGWDREIASSGVVAGHVFGHNYGSTGIAAIGDSSRRDWTRTWGNEGSTGMKAIEDAVTFECGRLYIDPTGGSDFLKSDDTWHLELDHCSGHSDSYNTVCPGKTLYAYLPNLRANVANRLNGGPSPVLNGRQSGNSLIFTWSSTGGANYAYCLEGWYKPAGAENITYLSGYEDQNSVYGDPLAVRQAWNSTTATSIGFENLARGQYTMHIRTASGTSADRYETNLTFLVTDESGGTDAPPSVTFTSPIDGTTVSGEVTLAANANDDRGVGQVEFFVDGNLIDADTTATDAWSVNWDSTSVTNGSRTLMATVTDTVGQTSSQTISVVVNNESVSSASLHVGDIDASSSSQGGTWTARVRIVVHNATHSPVSGAVVIGTWSGGSAGSTSSTTRDDGVCVMEMPKIPKKSSIAMFTVDGINPVSHYDASANHDLDGDSNGTSITVMKP